MVTQKQNKEILCIGHFCHDVRGDGFILGGTASYCSIVTSHLGYKTSVLTSVGPDFLFAEKFSKLGIEVCYKDAPETTIFENVYHGDERTQFLHARASVLFQDDLPHSWMKMPIVKFCSIADEIHPSLLKAFPESLIGATIQGWLRKWDEQGKVSPKEMDWELLNYIDVIIMSADDIRGFEYAIPDIAERVKVLVITKGHEDAVIISDGISYEFPAYPTTAIDPTGAGDVFAASFLTQYAESEDITRSASFAHCAASFVVEDWGMENLASMEMIEERLVTYNKQFR